MDGDTGKIKKQKITETNCHRPIAYISTKHILGIVRYNFKDVTMCLKTYPNAKFMNF